MKTPSWLDSLAEQPYRLGFVAWGNPLLSTFLLWISNLKTALTDSHVSDKVRISMNRSNSVRQLKVKCWVVSVEKLYQNKEHERHIRTVHRTVRSLPSMKVTDRWIPIVGCQFPMASWKLTTSLIMKLDLSCVTKKVPCISPPWVLDYTSQSLWFLLCRTQTIL